jgi:arsenical pump membrane protein
VTVLLSNDATAVVLTPAVYAATRAAGANPLPYLFACAFIANAASFALPISNPANLVVFGGHMPRLATWIAWFALPSLLSIGATYLMLRLTQAGALRRERIAREVPRPVLRPGGRVAAGGVVATVMVLMLCSALDVPLGLPTFICGVSTTAVILLLERRSPWPLLRGVSWSVVPLVAGLFVLVEGLDRAGLIAMLSGALRQLADASTTGTTWLVGLVVAAACNLMNNLPAGLVAGSVAASGALPNEATGAALIGVDLGPNLSVTGSLATLLWLVALRREGQTVSGLDFLKLGVIVTPPALVLSLASLAWRF